MEGESILPVLKAHTGETSDNSARKFYTTAGAAAGWWLRSASSGESFYCVLTYGGIGPYTPTIPLPPRPVFKVANNTLVSDKTADTIYILPDASKPYRELSFMAFLGSTAQRPKRAKVQVEIAYATERTIQISNNAKDANPAWVTCELDQVVELPNAEKTTDLWELGVKIYAKGEGKVTCGEPVAIVEVE